MLTYQGWSGIFALPYRIQAKEPLAGSEVKGDGKIYRVYPPFLRRMNVGPITDDVPLHLWPGFQWHPEAPAALRGALVQPLNIRYEEAVIYDGLRVDVLGTDNSDAVLQFVRGSMRWLRLLSGQPWISDLDHHFEPTLKRIFMVDSAGRASGELTPVLEMVAITTIRLVTMEIWKAAFEAAANNRQVPVYWNLYFDAMNSAASGDYARFVMILAMALESCRDQNFSKIHPSKFVAGRGPRLLSPFDHTNLLNHVSKDAEKAFKRNFADEMSEHWSGLKNLYVARHQVAHGGGPAYRGSKGMIVIDQKTHDPLRSAARAVIVWMEMVSGNKIHLLLTIKEPQTVNVSLSTA